VLARDRLDRLVSLGLKHVARELHVLFVVLDDQYGAHGRIGSVTVNVEPLPGWLARWISPPCSSMKRLVSARPKPVPSALRVQARPNCTKSANTFSWSSVAMPMPVSFTAISTFVVSSFALTSTRPPSGVNFTALDSRLRRICFTLRS